MAKKYNPTVPQWLLKEGPIILIMFLEQTLFQCDKRWHDSKGKATADVTWVTSQYAYILVISPPLDMFSLICD